MKTTARKEYGKYSDPCWKLAGMIQKKLTDFAIDGLEHGFTMERAKACETALGHMKEALAVLMMAAGASRANAMCEIEEKLGRQGGRK